jgi:hypothetical protein
MITKFWTFGERVVHAHKPEWGVGTVTAASKITHDGKACQSLTIRFERAGVKTLNTAYADLVSADALPSLPPEAPPDDPEPLGRRSVPTFAAAGTAGSAGRGTSGSGGNGGSGGGGGFAQAFAEAEAKALGLDARSVMTRLPDATTDPFTTVADRIKATYLLYKWSPVGGKLLDWAAVQTGLKDPMSRFNRHELEKFFEAFAVVRDQHLKKLLQELKRTEPGQVAELLRLAPPPAQQAMRRLDAMR